MKRHASFPHISIWVVMALGLWPVIGAPPVWAQKQQAQPAPIAPQGPLDERIILLEQRILDLQTVIGTLQTFVRDGGGVPAQEGVSPAGGGAVLGGAPSELSIRVLALETQIKALTAQMEQITSRIDQINTAAGTQSPPGAPPLPPDQQLGTPPSGVPFGQSQPQQRLGSSPTHDLQQGAPGFGTRSAGPRLQRPFADPGPAPLAQPSLQPPPPPVPPAVAQPPVFSPAAVPGAGEGARAVYDASYQSFLRNDFQGAGDGFQRFVKIFPDDPLTGNAYYWLGRTHYEGRKFERAAKAFLAGYKKDKKGSIAADALLYLGMSLSAMGEKEAACSTLNAFSVQFPDAPASLKQDVGAALKRTRC